MADICPNRNSPEWKQLVDQLGEHMAEITFYKLGGMPDVKGITEIKKDIKWIPKTENFTAIANRIARYNSKNGTSHRFEKKHIYGNTYELTFIPSYLPVTLEAQRLKAARKHDVFRVENLTEESFRNIEPRFKHSANEGELGKFNEEGDFIPLDDTDELVSTASSKIENIEKKRKQRIEKEALIVRQSLIGDTDIDSIKAKTLRLERLKIALDRAEGLIIESGGIEAYEEVLRFAKRQLEEVDKLLNSENLTSQDILYIRKVVDLWKKAGDFSVNENEHMFLDKNEFNTPEIRQEFKFKQEKAEDFDRKLTDIEEDLVVEWIRKSTNSTISREEIFKSLVDTNKINALTSNLSRHDDAMLQTIFSVVERANIQAQQEAQEIWKQLDSLGGKILKKQGNFNIYQQIDEDGNKTGRMVHRFAPAFWQTRNQYINNAFKKRNDKGQIIHTKESVEQYWKWVNENTINFDVRLLFADTLLEDSSIPSKFLYSKEYTQEEIDSHIIELKSHLGEKGYEFYIEQTKKKIEKFKLIRETTYQAIMEEDLHSQEEKEDLFEMWSREHSPYWGAEMQENPSARRTADGKSFYSAKGIREYGVQVPRKNINGKETKWYDKNFEKVESDEDLLAFHNFMIETLNDLNQVLPADKKRLMGVGSIPSMKKSIMDIFNEKGMMMGVTPFFDKFKELQTTTDLGTIAKGDTNPITGEIEKSINVQFVEDNRKKINELTIVKKLKYEQETGKIAGSAELKKFKAEATDEIASQQSWDLVKVMKAYSLSVLAYKQKAFIEPQIKIAEKIFNDRHEKALNEAGEQLVDKNGKPLTKKGLPNYKSAMDFYLNSAYYGIGGRKVEGVSNKKLYTKEEQVKKKEIEDLMEKASPEEKVFLQQQLDELGGKRTTSGTIDAILKYNTILALGWNFGSAFSNIGFGVISNIIQSSDGREYSAKNLRRAYMLVTNSIGRNISFNTLDGINGNGLKIRTLMDKYDLLQTSNKELFDTSQKSSFAKFKRFGPMSLQERSEYLNIAPVMIAVMMDFKATSPDGTETTLWDAYDIESGKLKEGYTSDVDEVRMIQKIKRIVEMNHGDYNNPLQVKETVTGRVFSQFRTWMFEGFKNRFEAQKVDYTLSYGLDHDYVRKGRYRSYTQGQIATTGAVMGTMFLPGIGTAVGGAIGYGIGKFAGMETEFGAVNDILFTLKQLLRKLTFQSTQFKDRFSEVDAANMRKNMTELYVLVSIMGIGLILQALAGDDDDKEKMWQLNFLINQTNRLTTDIEFYTNPLELQKLTQAAVPATSLVEKVGKFTMDVKNLFDDDKENDVFQSGAFKDDTKAVVHGAELIPVPSNLIKLYRQGATVFDK